MIRPKIIRKCEPLSNHSTLGIGGEAEYFAEPSSELELSEIVAFAQLKKLPLAVIGYGTNILFDDSGYSGVVAKIGPKMSSIRVQGTILQVQAGVWVPTLARRTQSLGLSGLEHIVGIPGTVGGLVVMNGGSVRKAIGDSIKSVRVVNPEGEVVELRREQCGFGYRESAFQGSKLIVVGADIECQQSTPCVIRDDMLRILRNRRRKFPRKSPNCGSVFVSDPDVFKEFGSPGAIIEMLGLKGYQVGGAKISDIHANFFVNTGAATAKDYLELVAFVQRKVKSAIGIDLRPEVVFLTTAVGSNEADPVETSWPLSQ